MHSETFPAQLFSFGGLHRINIVFSRPDLMRSPDGIVRKLPLPLQRTSKALNVTHAPVTA
jgi:hypothetical protein